MPRSYKPSDLPNPYLLTAPENLQFMERMDALEEAKKKTKAPAKAATVSQPHFGSLPSPHCLMSDLEIP